MKNTADIWIELHTKIKEHPKTYALMEVLKIGKAEAIGHLVCLWLWAIDNAEDGDLAPFTSAAIANAAEWSKKGPPFIEALVSCGWVDRQDKILSLHDWNDYAGRLIEKRQQSRDRAEKSRSKRAHIVRESCTLRNQENNAPCAQSSRDNSAPCALNRNLLDNTSVLSCPNSDSDAEKPKKNVPEFDHESDSYRLAVNLSEFIRDNNPNAKKQTEYELQKWALVFDRMIRLDKRKCEQIYEIMRYSQKDEFWKSNILSADTLRKQFDRLTIKMQQGR